MLRLCLLWMEHTNILPWSRPPFCCCSCSEGAKQLILVDTQIHLDELDMGAKLSFWAQTCSHALQVHFVSFREQFATLAASCTGGVIMFGPRLRST